jgi:gamma-glutamylcyclotransferase (GGCT)/AIG2-like uncharacterized protein YtfP
LRVAAARSLADKRTVDTAFIFVYGGLMRGFDLHHYLSGATFIGEGWIAGRLVALGRYPGLLDGDGKVIGEIYRLEDVAASLEALDDLEEFDPADPRQSVYLRVVRDVHGEDGATMSAWVYVYNRDASTAPFIRNGDWRQRAKTN